MRNTSPPLSVPGARIAAIGRCDLTAAATAAVSDLRDSAPGRSDHGELVEHDGCVLDEHRIRHVGACRQTVERDNRAPEALPRTHSCSARARARSIGVPREVRELAVLDRGGNVARDREDLVGGHGKRCSARCDVTSGSRTLGRREPPSVSPYVETASPYAFAVHRTCADVHRSASHCSRLSRSGASMHSFVRLGILAASALAPATIHTQPTSPVTTMFRGDPAHTGVASPLFAGQGGVKWRFATRSAVRSSPAVTATRVFIGSGDSTLYALDRATGKAVWRFAAGGPVHSSPAVARGLVIAATLGGRIFAVSEATGAAAMEHPDRAVATQKHPPGRRMGFLRVISDHRRDDGAHRQRRRQRLRAGPNEREGAMARQDRMARCGRLLRCTTVSPSLARSTVGCTRSTSRPGRRAGSIARSAIPSTSRRLAMTAERSRALPPSQTALVFFGSRDDGFYAVDFATGERKWRTSHGGSWVVGSPAVRDGRAYVGSSDGHFIQAVDVATGREVWRTPTTMERAVVAGSRGRRARRRHRGDERGTRRGHRARASYRRRAMAPAGRRRRVVVAGQLQATKLFIGSDDGNVYAIHQINPAIPRLAVYYDSTETWRPLVAGTRLAFEYFRGIGYQALNADSLVRFLTARIAGWSSERRRVRDRRGAAHSCAGSRRTRFSFAATSMPAGRSCGSASRSRRTFAILRAVRSAWILGAPRA